MSQEWEVHRLGVGREFSVWRIWVKAKHDYLEDRNGRLRGFETEAEAEAYVKRYGPKEPTP